MSPPLHSKTSSFNCTYVYVSRRAVYKEAVVTQNAQSDFLDVARRLVVKYNVLRPSVCNEIIHRKSMLAQALSSAWCVKASPFNDFQSTVYGPVSVAAAEALCW